MVEEKGKARIVFNSAAKTNNICINDHLCQGPDRNNSPRGVLYRMRRHPYVVTADVQNMFHQFAVPPDQRTYLQFFWFKGNDPEQEIIEYYTQVHFQGLKSSPSIAYLGIRLAAREHPPSSGQQWLEEDDLLDPHQSNRSREPDEIEKVLDCNFYVDDFLGSAPTEEALLNLTQGGIPRLQRKDMKLCKVQSNSPLVTSHYLPEESLSNTIAFQAPDNSPTEIPSTSLGEGWNAGLWCPPWNAEK